MSFRHIPRTGLTVTNRSPGPSAQRTVRLLERVASRDVCSAEARLPVLPQEQHEQVRFRRKIALAHLELSRSDLLHTFPAKADQMARIALVDDQPKILDRPGPVGTSAENVMDGGIPIGWQTLGSRRSPGAFKRGEQIPIHTIGLQQVTIAVLLGRVRVTERSLDGPADARLVAVLDHELVAGRECLLPEILGHQSPARRKTLFVAVTVLFDFSKTQANEFIPSRPRQAAQRQVYVRPTNWNTELAQRAVRSTPSVANAFCSMSAVTGRPLAVVWKPRKFGDAGFGTAMFTFVSEKFRSGIGNATRVVTSFADLLKNR